MELTCNLWMIPNCICNKKKTNVVKQPKFENTLEDASTKNRHISYFYNLGLTQNKNEELKDPDHNYFLSHSTHLTLSCSKIFSFYTQITRSRMKNDINPHTPHHVAISLQPLSLQSIIQIMIRETYNNSPKVSLNLHFTRYFLKLIIFLLFF